MQLGIAPTSRTSGENQNVHELVLLISVRNPSKKLAA
jgi:hypothetical protein